jgi:hypothetical protein
MLEDDSQLQIFNSLGKIVFDKKLQTGENSIKMFDATDGIYFVKIKNKEGIVTSKKIVIHN